MNMYQIRCSYGEVLDKLTIIEIKLARCNTEQFLSIQCEYDSLLKYKPKPTDTELFALFEKLGKVNQQLWDYEDAIRIKSKLGSFDAEYIHTAEQIHKTNDIRHELKRQISGFVDSSIVEEKIYKE
jgi:hypothetical protein